MLTTPSLPLNAIAPKLRYTAAPIVLVASAKWRKRQDKPNPSRTSLGS
jgi:hypothetical protein